MFTIHCHSNCVHRGHQEICQHPDPESFEIDMHLDGCQPTICAGYEAPAGEEMEISEEEDKVLVQRDLRCPTCDGQKAQQSKMCWVCWRKAVSAMKSDYNTCPKCHEHKDRQAALCGTCRDEMHRLKKLAATKKRPAPEPKKIKLPKPEPEKALCAVCSNEFTKKRKDQKYCGRKCLVIGSAYDKCPGCGQRKSKLAPTCRTCRKARKKVPPESGHTDVQSKPAQEEKPNTGVLAELAPTEARENIVVFKCERCSALIRELQPEPFLREPFECYKDQGGCGKRAGATRFTLEFQGDPPYHCTFPGCKFELPTQNAMRGHIRFCHNLKYNLPVKGNPYYRKLKDFRDDELKKNLEVCICKHQPPCMPCKVAFYILHEREQDGGKQHWDELIARKANA